MVKALLLGSLPYRSSLVARTIPLVGLIGAPLLLITNLGVLFGLWPHVSALTAISALPIALWEFSLGVWLVAKGFKPSPVTDGMVTAGLPKEDDHAPVRGGSRPELYRMIVSPLGQRPAQKHPFAGQPPAPAQLV